MEKMFFLLKQRSREGNKYSDLTNCFFYRVTVFWLIDELKSE